MTAKNNIHVLSRAVILDKEHILVCKTLDLPNNFFFLPGGHVENGESVESCLVCELIEETGQKCYIERFLGCLEFSFDPGHSSICHNHEYNFIFEVSSPTLKVDSEIAQLEPHLVLSWVPLEKLAEVDFRAEPLKTLIFQWLKEPPNTSFYSIMK